MNPLIRRETTILPLLIGLAIACFALAPLAEATPPPRPENRGNGNSAAENVEALNIATTGSNNTAHGWFSLFSDTSGSSNTADGFQALYSNTLGQNNTAVGVNALSSNSVGSFNVALGSFAGGDLTIGDDNIDIGNSGVAGDNGTIRIGEDIRQLRTLSTFIAGIRGVTTGNADAIPVLIDSLGQLGTVSIEAV